MIYTINKHDNFDIIELQEDLKNLSEQDNLVLAINEIYVANRNLILNLNGKQILESSFFEVIKSFHEKFYEQNCSFVVCHLNEVNKSEIKSIDLEDIQFAPLLIEAIDLVSMEILERDILGEDF